MITLSSRQFCHTISQGENIMTTYTKESIPALAAKDLLLSWTSGTGATGKTPERFNHVKTGALKNVSVTLDQLTAIAEMLADKAKLPASSLEAFKQGFLSDKHVCEYMKSKAPVLEGHYLTAAQYLESCFDLLPEKATPSFEDILAVLNGFKPSTMSKADLVDLITKVVDLCTVEEYTVNDLSTEQQAKYNDLVAKETALSHATQALSPYLEDIVPVAKVDNSIAGKFYPSNGRGKEFSKLIEEEGYTVVDMKQSPELDDDFKPVYTLFVLKVI